MFTFPGQREGEKILAKVNKHTIVFVKIVIAFLVVIILPVVLLLFFWFKFYPLSEHYYGGVIAGIFSCIFLLFGLLFTCIRWINEEFDVFLITTERLVDNTQISFLKRSVTSTPLEHIQDTTGLVNGFLPTLLHYGDLTVQTAGSQKADIFIDRIPDPEGVARLILDWAHKKRDGGLKSASHAHDETATGLPAGDQDNRI